MLHIFSSSFRNDMHPLWLVNIQQLFTAVENRKVWGLCCKLWHLFFFNLSKRKKCHVLSRIWSGRVIILQSLTSSMSAGGQLTCVYATGDVQIPDPCVRHPARTLDSCTWEMLHLTREATFGLFLPATPPGLPLRNRSPWWIIYSVSFLISFWWSANRVDCEGRTCGKIGLQSFLPSISHTLMLSRLANRC